LKIRKLKEIQLIFTNEGHTDEDPISGITNYGVYKDERAIRPCVLITRNGQTQRDFRQFWDTFCQKESTARNQPLFEGYNYREYGFGEADIDPQFVEPRDESFDSYETSLKKAVEKMRDEDLNLLFVVIPEHFSDEQYYKLKALCFNENQVSQFFKTSTFQRKFPLVFWNLAISIYAKMEGIPWQLALRPPIEKENLDVDLFIGICLVQRDARSFVGVATVLNAFSEHIITVSSKPIMYVGQQLHMEKDDICNLVRECLRNVDFSVKSIVIHYATPFNKDELDGVNEALANIPEKTFVHLETESLVRIYSLSTTDNDASRGTALIMSDRNAILCTTGRTRLLGTSAETEDEVEEQEGGFETSFRYKGIGTPKPVGVNKYGDLPIDKVCRQILALTKLRWNTAEVNVRIPATIEYSRRVGYLCKYGIPHIVKSIKYVL
jgi:hypothetical protein